MRIHPRSGLSFKGLVLGNMEGVVDSDYVEEVYVMLWNSTNFNDFLIKDGDRIAQAEIVENNPHVLLEITTRPSKKTDRNGGFGSTGV
jgi:dUTP pyrophosphatase